MEPNRQESGRSGEEQLHRRLTGLVSVLLWAGLAGALSAQVITEFPIPTAGSGTEPICLGPDGNLWFGEEFGNKVGRITPAGSIVDYPVPTAGGNPEGIAAGPDGSLWFTEIGASKIGRITTGGVITEFPIGRPSSQPSGITTGADGNLWFCEISGNRIGRITTAGVVKEFLIPTTSCHPEGITRGPDGNVWFVEQTGNKIGRITPTGVITEFPITTASSSPWNITLGPDGNLWFTEGSANQIGRITPAGVITEFPTLTPGLPDFITAGPDGNIWFSLYDGDKIGRITPDGVVTEFPLPHTGSQPYGIAAGPDGALWFPEQNGNNIGRITTGPTIPVSMKVDAANNGVLEAGETVAVDPTWTNTLVTSSALTGTASTLTGPAGPTYTINDSSADYGTIPAESSADCDGATGDCYQMTVSGSRPAPHWDATFKETLSDTVEKTWKLHVGETFPDVPTTHPFYAFVENLFHNGVTGGCLNGNYCPSNSVTRAQMAVFLLKGKLGATLYSPPAATGTVFNDVHVGDFAANWIEALAGFQITGGCGNGAYCPNNSVTRAQMAVFLLKAEHGSAYTPPTCVGTFSDVACPSQFANWIEQLATEQITGGCGGGKYCPDDPITRGQMAVFLVKTFKLLLYGP